MHNFLSAAAAAFILMAEPAFAVDFVGRIESVQSGKCLDVSGFSKEAGAPIIQYSCTGGDNQKWTIKDKGDGVHEIAVAHSGMCMDVSGASTADLAPIIQYPCNGQSNQGFRLNDIFGRFTFMSVNSSKCLDIEGGVDTDGAKLIQYTCSGQANQQFRLR